MLSFRKMNLFALIFFIVFISGCVQTNVTSLKDPTYNGRSFKRILVIGAFQNTEVLKSVELKMIDELGKIGIYGVANHLVLPPLREYTDEEKRNVFIQQNLDSYIIIAPQGFNTATVYVPTVSNTKGSANVVGNTVTGRSKTTTYEGGARQINTGFNSQAKLYDFSNGYVIWQGDVSGNSNKNLPVIPVNTYH
jgi:hypothetical protein